MSAQVKNAKTFVIYHEVFGDFTSRTYGDYKKNDQKLAGNQNGVPGQITNSAHTCHAFGVLSWLWQTIGGLGGLFLISLPNSGPLDCLGPHFHSMRTRVDCKQSSGQICMKLECDQRSVGTHLKNDLKC